MLTILLLCLAILQTILGLGVEVEDVTGKQLEAALQTEELLAVMFCKYPSDAFSGIFPLSRTGSEIFRFKLQTHLSEFEIVFWLLFSSQHQCSHPP